MLDHDETLGLRHVQWTQDERIQHREDDRVGADAESEGQYSGRGETGRLPQNAQAVASVVDRSLDKIPTGGLMALLAKALVSTELDPRAPLGFGTRYAGTFKIVRTVLDVRAQLFFHLGIQFGTMKESSDAEAQCVEESHASSGWSESAQPMAATRRFQLSVSSRNRFLPAVVSS